MIQKTCLFRSSVFAALFGVASTVSLLAQGPGGPPPGGPGGGGRGPHHGPPPDVLFAALDTNHDGVISADEMANASASLKTLLKNGATELKREDLRPPRPAPPQDGGPESAENSDHHRPRPPQDGGPAFTEGNHHRPQPPQDGGPESADSDHHRPQPPEGRFNDEKAGPEGRAHHGPPPSPLFDALDANHDGTISADEMANASTALKSLLKNGATQLKREDLRPPRPPQDQED